MIEDTVAIVVRKGNKILLVKRLNKPWQGYWAVPGGHVDKGESVYEAAEREIKEEVGDVKIGKELGVFTHNVPSGERGNSKPHKHRCHVFTGKVVGKIRAGSDAGEIGWFNIKELKKIRITRYTKECLKFQL